MRKLLLIFAFMLCALGSWAVKADPTPLTVVQSDGKPLTITFHGDEDMSWHTTTDGVLLIQSGRDYHIARVAADGTLQSTGILAHNAGQRTAKELQAIAAQNTSLFFNKAESLRKAQRQRRISVSSSAAYFPHTGSPKALVILVNFQDTTFTAADPKKNFEQYLNATDSIKKYDLQDTRLYKSVYQYFNEMSFGKFTPQFDLVGPIQVSQSSAYYGADSGSIKDVKGVEMIKEACKLVDDSVNFADYDSDGDGKVDLVYIIYAGHSQSINGNPTDCLWPKSGYSSGLGSFDGVQVYRYGINNELNGKVKHKFINGIGLFCHEFSHTLGLPDFYPTIAAAQIDNQAMEYWDLMDGGEYVASGYCPTPYTPWERETMGWLELETLSDTAQVTLKPVQQGGTAYKILSDNEDEYLIVENIQKKGFYQKLPADGMIVYRVNYPYSTVNLSDRPNNTAGKPGMTIVPADGLLITSYNDNYTSVQYKASMAHDLYPDSGAVKQILEVELNESTLKKPIYNIDMTDGLVTFDFLKDFTQTGITGVETRKATDGYFYSLDGIRMGKDASLLRPGIYIRNKKKVYISK